MIVQVSYRSLKSAKITEITYTILKIKFTISKVEHKIFETHDRDRTNTENKRFSYDVKSKVKRSYNLILIQRRLFQGSHYLTSESCILTSLNGCISYDAYVIVQVLLAGFFILNIAWITSHWNNSRSRIT